ncbi:helix-turn-helix domain-containing protein [Paracoccus isoporae]|uniref:helix-turn-helix domain-containing protein n=1 Tax=Paracoccus isoporae TaxID=591205 RepID=UPI000B84C837|nr:helix-turn-helix domain-containing protein [Paracoccus isoporae]
MAEINVAHERLKTDLRLRGTNMTELARDLGVTPASVTTVSQGVRRSARIEAALAAAVGRTVAEVFPDRYPPDDTE